MAEMKVVKGGDSRSGGDYVEVTLSNGRIVTVWDDSNNNQEGENFGVIEIHESLEAQENGEMPRQHLV